MDLQKGDFVDVAPGDKRSGFEIVEHLGETPVIPGVRVESMHKADDDAMIVEGRIPVRFDNGTVIDVQVSFDEKLVIKHRSAHNAL